jgi:hypothetical protein
MKEKLKGSVSIYRPLGRDCDYIGISLDDESSRCRLLDIRIPFAEFVEALTGRGNVSCEFDFFNDCPVGKIYEHKTEIVPRPQGYVKPNERKAVSEFALAQFEVDGWMGRDDDLFNHHKSKGDSAVVTFHRYVDPPTEETPDSTPEADSPAK